MAGMDRVCHDLPLVDPCFFPSRKGGAHRSQHARRSLLARLAEDLSKSDLITGSPATFFLGGRKHLWDFLFGIIEVNNKTHPRFGTYHLLKTKCRGDSCCDINPRGGFLRWYCYPYKLVQWSNHQRINTVLHLNKGSTWIQGETKINCWSCSREKKVGFGGVALAVSCPKLTVKAHGLQPLKINGCLKKDTPERRMEIWNVCL